MRDERQVEIVPGPGGWSEVTQPSGTVYVRFALNADKKTVRIVDLRVPNPTSEVLRSLRLARIETMANASAAVMLAFAVRHTEDAPEDVPGFFRRNRKHFELSQRAGRFVLERPEGRRLDNDFYMRVAKAYRDAVANGLAPRQTLARDTGAAPDTVARWVSEARRRHYLPPGKPGKVTVGAREGVRIRVPNVTYDVENGDLWRVAEELRALGTRVAIETADRLEEHRSNLDGEPLPFEPTDEESAVIARALDHLRNLNPRGWPSDSDEVPPRDPLHRVRHHFVAAYAPRTYRLTGQADGRGFWSYSGAYSPADRLVDGFSGVWRVLEVRSDANGDPVELIVESW